MFNKTIYKTESKVVAVTKEIEKTISPDKVTEMYDVIKEEIENNIVRKVIINNTQYEGSIVIYKNQDDFTDKVITRFILNGKEYIDKTNIGGVELDKLDNYEEMKKHFIDVVSGKLLETFMITKSRGKIYK